jgi:hypothetical protein
MIDIIIMNISFLCICNMDINAPFHAIVLLTVMAYFIVMVKIQLE